MEYFGHVSSQVKPEDSNQVLTEADIATGTFLVQAIGKQYPDHNIIDEEAGIIDHNSNFTWVIDPIDGTSNFATGLPMFGIMVGVLEDGQPTAGGIILPYFHDLILADRGHGAFLNDQRITIPENQRLSDALVAYGLDGHREDPDRTRKEMALVAEIALHIRNLRCSNSGYDMVQVALGKYGAFLNQTTKIWDNVAVHSIIEEAGGLYTDFYGQPMDYTNPLQRVDQNYTVCAAGSDLHQELQKIIHDQS